ncbi:MAG: DUF480 domain-containing protein [Thiotrichales bacterium]
MTLSPLSDFDAYVLGVLLELELVSGTPSPLALTALRDGCHRHDQLGVRSPDDANLDAAMETLLAHNLITTRADASAGATLYKSQITARFGFDLAQLAALSLLLRGGPQSAQELAANGQYLYPFSDPESVTATLESLRDHPAGPFVERDDCPDSVAARYRHAFSRSEGLPAAPRASTANAGAPTEISDDLEHKLGELDRIIRDLVPK